mgnify:CR=1 FL=1
MSDQTPLIQELVHDAGSHAVLMLHGLGAAPFELARLAQEAHQEGFSVRVPAIEGYCYGSTPQAWTHWRDQVLDHYWDCKKKFETVSVLGVSMGATLALHLGEIETPTSVVALSAALGYDGWAIPWYHSLISLASWFPFAGRYEYVEREPYGLKNRETRAMIKRMLQSQHISEVGAETLSLPLILEGRKLIRAVKTDAQKIQSPLLFIHAIDDESVHVRNPELIHRKARSKDKEFIYLGDSYHMITIDNERDTVNQETARFLKKSVNQQLEKPAFEVAPIKSSHLRRLLRKIQSQVFQI